MSVYSSSYPVMYWHVMSCQVMSGHVRSSHVMSCHVMSCCVMSYYVLLCHVMGWKHQQQKPEGARLSRPTHRTECRSYRHLGSPPGAGASAMRWGARLAFLFAVMLGSLSWGFAGDELKHGTRVPPVACPGKHACVRAPKYTHTPPPTR